MNPPIQAWVTLRRKGGTTSPRAPRDAVAEPVHRGAMRRPAREFCSEPARECSSEPAREFSSESRPTSLRGDHDPHSSMGPRLDAGSGSARSRSESAARPVSASTMSFGKDDREGIHQAWRCNASTRAAWVLIMFLSAFCCLANGAFLSPEVVVASPTGHEVYVAATMGQQLLVVDRASGTVSRRILLSAPPSGLVLSPDGTTVYITAGIAPGFVSVLDVRTGTERARIPAGHSPIAPVLSADGKTLFVGDRFRSRLLALDLA